jgi:hypothetical protein
MVSNAKNRYTCEFVQNCGIRTLTKKKFGQSLPKRTGKEMKPSGGSDGACFTLGAKWSFTCCLLKWCHCRCAETFGINKGQDYMVSHYLFQK